MLERGMGSARSWNLRDYSFSLIIAAITRPSAVIAKDIAISIVDCKNRKKKKKKHDSERSIN